MANWLVGLQPGNKQVGDFLSRTDSRYERECSELLLEQIRNLKPVVILLLGLPVVGRSHRIMPALRHWADAANWNVVDSSSLGPVAYGVEISGTEVTANVVALLHPSFSPSNQRYRRAVFPVRRPCMIDSNFRIARQLAHNVQGTTRFRVRFRLDRVFVHRERLV